MASLIEIMQLCRLCLVKDQVNIPIFEEQGDVRQIFLKLAACFPTVQVSRDDNLPKKICESCMFKLEHSYQFWSLTTNAEKQLNVWLKQIGLDANSKVVGQQSLQMVAQSHAHPHSLETETVILKQEAIDPIDVRPDIGVSSDTQSYILQQQQLPYQPVGFQYEQPPAFSQPSTSSNTGPSATVTSATNEPAMLGKRKRRQVITNPIPSSEESDDDEDIQPPKIAKEEEDSDSADDNEPLQPTAFVSVPAISQDAEQPGPSGLNKPTAGSTSEAPTSITLPKGICLKIINGSIKNDDNDKTKQIVTKANECESVYEQLLNQLSCDLKNDAQNMQVLKDDTDQIIANLSKAGVRTEKLCAASTVTDVKNFLDSNSENSSNSSDDISDYKMEQYDDSDEEYLPEKRSPKTRMSGQEHQKKKKLYDKTNFIRIKSTCYVCAVCATRFANFEDLNHHMKSTTPCRRISVTCPICGKEFINKSRCTAHMNIHKEKAKFPCGKCGKEFPNRIALHAHVDTLHTEYFDATKDGFFQCKLCVERATSKQHILQHINTTHLHVSTFLCDICGKSFLNEGGWRAHVLIHSETKPFMCQICSKAFKMQSSLRVHIRTHSQERRYVCDECGKSFKKNCTLREHKKHHSGELPFVCTFCDKRCGSKTTLSKHMNIHHPGF